MSQSFFLITLICTLPLAGIFINLLLKKYVSYLSTSILFFTLILIFYLIGFHQNFTSEEITWFKTKNISLQFTYILQQESIIMLPVIAIISFLVHCYSIGYMASEKENVRYFNGLLFFTASMFLFVTSGNLLVIFTAWEFLGLASYLLIGFYRSKPEASLASLKAMLLNRFSDVLLFASIILLYHHYQTFNLSEILSSKENIPDWIAFTFLAGVLAKSAQFPLMNWLPSAMTGPSPVSALIHAATMVIAGVFLMIRISPILPTNVLNLTTSIGCITALLGAFAATQQFDLKKILAYSTISQLGLMMAAVGIEISEAALLHMVTHAFFKAGLFLGVGALIHQLKYSKLKQDENVQDIRNLGGLFTVYPRLAIIIGVYSLALCGIPFTSGFLSKEYLLIQAWQSSNSLSHFYFIIVILTSVITVMYTVRMFAYTFFNKSKEKFIEYNKEKDSFISIPLNIFAFASLWILVNINPFAAKFYFFQKDEITTPILITVGSAILFPALMAIIFIYYTKTKLSETSNQFLFKGFGLDYFQNLVFVKPSQFVSNQIIQFEKQVIDTFLHSIAFVTVLFSHIVAFLDYWLVDGFVRFSYKASYAIGGWVRISRSGYVQQYLFWFLFTVVLFLIWVLF